jgi:hypothetical protein
MSPHFDPNSGPSAEKNQFVETSSIDLNDTVVEGAAEALRQADLEAAQEEFDLSSLKLADLERMTIDELRVVAKQLDVPDRASIIEQDELIAAIRRRM